MAFKTRAQSVTSLGDGADLVEGRCIGDEAIPAYQPIGGLHPYNTTQGRGLPDAASGVRTKGVQSLS